MDNIHSYLGFGIDKETDIPFAVYELPFEINLIKFLKSLKNQ